MAGGKAEARQPFPPSREPKTAVLLLLSLSFSHFALARFLCRSGRAVLSITDNQSGALAVKRGEELGTEVVPAEGSGGRAGQGEGG